MELVQPEFIFLNETLIFQFEAIATTDILHGDFNYVLTSDDSFDPELPSQFGNEKGLNIQHYLVTTLDTNNEQAGAELGQAQLPIGIRLYCV